MRLTYVGGGYRGCRGLLDQQGDVRCEKAVEQHAQRASRSGQVMIFEDVFVCFSSVRFKTIVLLPCFMFEARP